MNWHDLGLAAALFLVLEGILPFLSPQGLRNMLVTMLSMNDTQMRFAGLSSMLLGLLLLYAVNG